MDSANRTFLTMLLLTLVFFGLTTTQIFFKKDDVNKKSVSDTFQDIHDNKPKISESLLFEVIDPDYSSDFVTIYENEKIKIQFNRKNGSIEKAWVKKGNENYLILDSNDSLSGFTIKLGSWLTGKSIYSLTGGKEIYNLKIEDNIFIFSIKFKDPINSIEYLVEKKFTFYPDEFIFKLDLVLSNNKNIPFNFDSESKAFSIGWGPTIGVKSTSNNKRAPNYDVYGYLLSEKYIKLDEKNKIFKENEKLYAEFPKMVKDKWIVANSHYYAAVMIPIDNADYFYFIDYRNIKNDQSYMGISKKTENSVIKSSFAMYLGPKLSSELKKYNDFSSDTLSLTETNLTKLDDKIMFGLGNAIGSLLKLINKYVNNYGLAIILLTLIIKLLLSPLTHHSMVSQQKMQTLQPKMKEIQDKYKDKPDLLNKKTMELYQKEGINPMSGCLPLLLQMPILFAMYQLLDRMVELKGENFLWIKDLAMPDSIINFNFTIPLLNSSSLNILPILMVITQIFTSLLTPDVQNNKQTKMMMWMMPLMFFFFFYNVSSALVLYWTTMNILGIFQQAYIKYKGSHAVLKK